MSPDLDSILRTELATALLEVSRVGGALIAAPLAWSHAPVRVRVGLALLLTLVAHSMTGVLARPELSPSTALMAIVPELLLGVSIGFVVRLSIAVAEIAAEHLAPVMGIGVAQVFDPQSHGMQNVLNAILRHFVVLLALLVGVHRIMVAALLASFRHIPVGSAGSIALSAPRLLDLTCGAIHTGVRIALPVLAVLFMVQVALAFISRAAPAMQIFSIGFAVTVGGGLLVLHLVLPDTTYELLREFSQTESRLESVLLPLRKP